MHKSKIESLNPQEYTHLPHAEQHFEDHEQTDVAIRPLVWTLIGIASIIVVSGVGMWGLFNLYKHLNETAENNQPLSAVSTMSDPRQVPQGMPDLQGVPAEGANPRSPAQDMNRMRQRNDKVLAGLEPMRDGMRPGMSIDAAMSQALESKIFKTAKGGATTAPATTQPAGTQPAAPPPPAGQSADAAAGQAR
jgi:hypothetical protein